MIEPKQCQNMSDIRNAIDTLDNNIIKLMSKRLEFVKEASRFKKDETAVRDIDRVREVVESKKKLATEYNLPPELIGKIYEMIIDSFIKEELKEWEKRG